MRTLMSVYPSFGARLGLIVLHYGPTILEQLMQGDNILVLAERFKKNQGCSSVTGDLDYEGYFANLSKFSKHILSCNRVRLLSERF